MNMSCLKRIQLVENETLLIKNALIREIPAFEKVDRINVINSMRDYVKFLNGSICGPLITATSGIIEVEKGIPTVNTRIIMQLQQPLASFDSPYNFKSSLNIGPCLLVHFIGNPHDIHFAHTKLSLFSYENNIKLEGSSYTVYKSNNEEIQEVDIFMPLKIVLAYE